MLAHDAVERIAYPVDIARIRAEDPECAREIQLRQRGKVPVRRSREASR